MPVSSQTTADIDRVFSTWDRQDAPGFAVGIVRDGAPVYRRGFGLANVEHGVPNTSSTLFDIGSVTKQFTAFAIHMLLRDGKVGLDDDVRDYVPELPPYDPPVRIRHCLYHTGGLTDWIAALELAGPTSDYRPVKCAVRTLAALTETMFPAGRAHSYSNSGYVILAWLVWRASGMSLPEFLKARVFDPLGMTRAAFRSHPFEFFPGQAQGYVKVGDETLLRLTGATDVCGDGGMWACVDDMMRWMQNFTDHTVGDTEIFDRVFAAGQLDDGQRLRYAAGWVLERYRGHRAASHGGMSDGFQSIVFWLPDIGTGVVLLGNVRPLLPWRLVTAALDVLLGERTPDSQRASTGTASEILQREDQDQLAGTYFAETGLPVAVARDGDQVVIDIGLWKRPFVKVAADTYRNEETRDTAFFHWTGDGRISHFTMAGDDDACFDLHSPIAKAVKYDNRVLVPAELTVFEGCYVSKAIESTYRVTAAGDGLRAKHRRCDDWFLRPVSPNTASGFADEFAQDGTWPGLVAFERGPNKAITGFRVRGARVNLFFAKQ